MSKMSKMTKVQAVKQFKEDNKEFLKSNSKTTIRCVWNDYIDSLYEDNQITEKQAYNWDHPSFCK
jgi:hypothetical protein